jgi:hypothetical protein
MYLFAAFLGGPIAGGRMGEDHEVVFVVASSADEAKRLAKGKWGGEGRAHVDAVQRIDAVDGHEISVSTSAHPSGDRVELHSYN